MDKQHTPLTDILAYCLVLLLVANGYWFFNQKSLSDNTDMLKATSELSISASEKVVDNGLEYLETYCIKGDLNNPDVQAVISVMDEIQSRKRNNGNIGGVTVAGPAIDMDVSFDYRINDRYVSLVMTNERNVMFDMGTRSVAYTLQDGDLGKLFQVIKQYGTKL